MPALSTNSSNKKMSKLIALIIGLLLLVSNPTKTEFEGFVSNQITANLPSKNATSDRFTNQLIGGLVSKLASEATQRDNYYLLSVYTVDLAMLRLFKPELPPTVKIIGIGSKFFPLTDNQIFK